MSVTSKFMVGDKVIANRDIYPEGNMIAGSTGTVVVVDEYDEECGIGVEWDSNEVWGHDLDGALDNDRGYWVCCRHLDFYEGASVLTEFEAASMDEVAAFLGEMLCLK